MASRLLSRTLLRPQIIPRCAVRFPRRVQRRSIMDLSCFTPEQLMVKDAISKICEKFPDVLYFLPYL